MQANSFLKFSIFSFFIAIVFSSCTSTSVYKSVAEENMKKEIQYIGFDNQSAIRYSISNDNEYLYVRLEALSRPSVLKIIQSGFYIYIDTLGKRAKEMWFNYPMGKTDQLFQAKLFREDNHENDAITAKIELESQIKDVGKFAAFVANAVEESVDNDIEKGFEFHLEPGKYGSLNYYAAIRLDKIKKGGYASLDQFSIGIISGAFKKPNLAGTGGGAVRGRLDRVPQAQSQSNVDPKKLRNMYLMSQPIAFWINLKLYKP